MAGNAPTNQDPASATVIESGSSSGPPEPQNAEQPPSAIHQDTTTSAAIADIARLFSDEQDTPVTTHNSLHEMGQLRSALRSASAKSSNGCEDTGERPTTSGTGTPMRPEQQEEVPSPVGSEAPISASVPKAQQGDIHFRRSQIPRSDYSMPKKYSSASFWIHPRNG